jgi:MoaA/NifB/PqqE/SkfB family radical SAM enzyme
MVTNATSSELTGVEQAASNILDAAGLLRPDWALLQLDRLDRRTVAISLGPSEGKHVLLHWTEHGGETTNAFLKGQVYAVAYSKGPGAWDLDSADTPSDVKELAVQSCKILSDVAEAVGVAQNTDTQSPPDEKFVALSADAFTEWLSADIRLGDALIDGWRLTQIYPRGHEELVLAFEHSDFKVEPRIRIRLRDDNRPAAFRTQGLDITYRGNADETLQGGRKEFELRIAADLVLLLKRLEGSHTRFTGRPGQDSTDLSLPSEHPPGALNLAIPAPCGIQCSFCSIREELEFVHDPRSAFVESLKEDIRRAGAKGTQLLRVNGVEPLNAPYLLDLLELARESGFTEYSLHSTCLPFAEGDLAERYIAAMPDRYRIYVPIYGATAQVHDGVTGAPGSFARLMKAVAKLQVLVSDGGQIIFTTVLTTQNRNQVTAMRDLVRPLGDWWEVHLAFPNTSSATDKYRDIAISMTHALAALYPKDWWPVADLPWGEVLPCVAHKHQLETGHELVNLKRFNERVQEPAGTFYGSAGFEHSLGQNRNDAFTAATVPCPHQADCSLKDVCPAKVYALYEEKFGLDELSPISQETLDSLPDDGALSRAVANQRR